MNMSLPLMTDMTHNRKFSGIQDETNSPINIISENGMPDNIVTGPENSRIDELETSYKKSDPEVIQSRKMRAKHGIKELDLEKVKE
jgi:hypothetical protein